MIFFPRELCERLQAMGCKSESGYCWGVYRLGYSKESEDWRPLYTKLDSFFQIPEIVDPHWKHYSLEFLSCFSQNDFTGCHAQAHENARLVWGSRYVNKNGYKCPCCNDYKCPCCEAFSRDWDEIMMAYEFHRHAMINAPDAAKYLEETMEETMNAA